MSVKCEKCQSDMKYEMVDEFNHLEEVFTCKNCENQISYDEAEKKGLINAKDNK